MEKKVSVELRFTASTRFKVVSNLILENLTVLHESILRATSTDLTIKIILCSRMKTNAGKARCKVGDGPSLVKLHARLLTDNPSEIIPTLVHELCHIIAEENSSYPIGHGKKWRDAHKFFGIEPELGHEMDTSKYSRCKHEVFCGCSTHLVTAQVLNRISNGEQYRCAACNNWLQLTPLWSFEKKDSEALEIY